MQHHGCRRPHGARPPLHSYGMTANAPPATTANAPAARAPRAPCDSSKRGLQRVFHMQAVPHLRAALPAPRCAPEALGRQAGEPALRALGLASPAEAPAVSDSACGMPCCAPAPPAGWDAPQQSATWLGSGSETLDGAWPLAGGPLAAGSGSESLDGAWPLAGAHAAQEQLPWLPGEEAGTPGRAGALGACMCGSSCACAAGLPAPALLDASPRAFSDRVAASQPRREGAPAPLELLSPSWAFAGLEHAQGTSPGDRTQRPPSWGGGRAADGAGADGARAGVPGCCTPVSLPDWSGIPLPGEGELSLGEFGCPLLSPVPARQPPWACTPAPPAGCGAARANSPAGPAAPRHGRCAGAPAGPGAPEHSGAECLSLCAAPADAEGEIFCSLPELHPWPPCQSLGAARAHPASGRPADLCESVSSSPPARLPALWPGRPGRSAGGAAAVRAAAASPAAPAAWEQPDAGSPATRRDDAGAAAACTELGLGAAASPAQAAGAAQGSPSRPVAPGAGAPQARARLRRQPQRAARRAACLAVDGGGGGGSDGSDGSEWAGEPAGEGSRGPPGSAAGASEDDFSSGGDAGDDSDATSDAGGGGGGRGGGGGGGARLNQRRGSVAHITLQLLEEGGHFDRPIQACTPLLGLAARLCWDCSVLLCTCKRVSCAQHGGSGRWHARVSLNCTRGGRPQGCLPQRRCSRARWRPGPSRAARVS